MLNFKGWNKIKEDKDTTTLRHDKGHEMKLAHKGLPKIQKEALKRLKLAEGTDSGTVADAANKSVAPVTVNVTPTPPPAPPTNVNVPASTPKMTYPEGTINPTAVAQSVPAEANIRAQIEANMAAGEVQRQKEQQLEQARRDAILNQAQTHVNNAYDNFSKYNQKNPINENAYMESGGAGRKMTTALGLILGGAGAGVTGGPNLAYDFLNKQIDRNIEAQKSRLGQAKTVWEGARNLFQDNMAADSFTRAHQLDNVAIKSNIQAAQMGTATAAANNIKLQRDLGLAKQLELKNTAGRLSQLPNFQGNMPQGGAPPATPTEPNITQGPVSQQGVQNIAESLMGPKGTEAGIGKATEHDDAYDPILAPGAWEKVNNLQYSTEQDKTNYPKAFEQFTKAQQADTMLGQLHGVMNQLSQDARAGGGLGYLRRHDPTGHIPFLGPLISESTVQPSTANETNKRYEAYKTRITNDILTALKGTDAGPEEVRSMVESNIPEASDTPDLIARKERNIRMFIKNNIQRSMLEGYGISNKRH